MIPEKEFDLSEVLNEEQRKKIGYKTYQLFPAEERVKGNADGFEAVEQMIYKTLSTERYRYFIYSDNYGIELEDLYGQDYDYVCAELERRITESLTRDERIESVRDFVFGAVKNGVTVTFTAVTAFGDMMIEKGVEVNV